MAIDYEKLIADLVRPLVIHADDVAVQKIADDDDKMTMQVLVHNDDLGRVIGKNGRIANAIRTIAYASASREHKKITINIDAF